MTNKQLLDKWETLNIDEQTQILNLIESLSKSKVKENESKNQVKVTENQEIVYQPKTELGKKLWAIRQKIIADPNLKLLDIDDINAELDEMRGRNKF